MFQGSKLAVYTNKPTVQTNRQRLIHKAKMKSLRISVVIIVAFLICWTPYNVMMIIFTFLNPDKRVSGLLSSFSIYIVYLNICLLPASHLRYYGSDITLIKFECSIYFCPMLTRAGLMLYVILRTHREYPSAFNISLSFLPILFSISLLLLWFVK